ncbi:Peptidyl-Lys metalloendopeptidase [Hypsizygus marmoreus]|uniref:Peptidyl-Lys metalloendopeptidase n=1 Tax=Hypsizygus marmoreus TaxID=39966 RepID=A0A369K8V5_HYPMA|nr:Peptidyl-Lys metalloendopeptidase [Hypsizygus marmoreus]
MRFLTSIALAASLTALTAFAKLSLSMTATGPGDVDGVENLKLITSITNTGDEILKLVKDPRGPLSSRPTEAFDITDTNGNRPLFTGIRVKYMLDWVVSRGTAEHFTVLAPGQTINVAHNISEIYDFTHPGQGSYHIKARNLVYHVDNRGTVIPLHASSNTGHNVDISGSLRREVHTMPKELSPQITFQGCSPARQTVITNAITRARADVRAAVSALPTKAPVSTRFSTWFGVYNDQRLKTVTANLNKVSAADLNSFTYECSGAYPCEDGDVAYVISTTYGVVHLCSVYWGLSPSGADSQAGSLVHEASHFKALAGTLDITYGQASSKDLAVKRPNEAITNADNYEYYVENTPSL